MLHVGLLLSGSLTCCISQTWSLQPGGPTGGPAYIVILFFIYNPPRLTPQWGCIGLKWVFRPHVWQISMDLQL